MTLNDDEQVELGRQLHAMGHRLFGDERPLCEACGGSGYSAAKQGADGIYELAEPFLERLKERAAAVPLEKAEHRETFVPFTMPCQVCSSRDHRPTPPVEPDIYSRDGVIRGSCPTCCAEMGALPQTEQVRKTYEHQLFVRGRVAP